MYVYKGLSQDLEIGCPKLTMIKNFGILFFRGDHTILRLLGNHKHVFIYIMSFGLH